MTAPIVFVDTETTGLDPSDHEVWDIALITADGNEHEWHVKPQHLTSASPDALRISGFYERAVLWSAKTVDGEREVVQPGGWSGPRTVAWEVARLTAGVHLVGAVPSFDAAFLTRFLERAGYVPAWHYHLVDVEAMAAGVYGTEPPWDTSVLAKRLGLDPDEWAPGKHTAIGDARWAKAMYEACLRMGRDAGPR